MGQVNLTRQRRYFNSCPQLSPWVRTGKLAARPRLRHRARALAHLSFGKIRRDPTSLMLPCTPLDWTQGNLFGGLRCFHSGVLWSARTLGISMARGARAGKDFSCRGWSSWLLRSTIFSAVTAREPFPCCDLPCSV